MSAARWSLAHLRVGLSVAGDREDLARHGFTEAGMNRFTVRLSRALLAEGAALAFGHDWRPEGVMEAVASIAFDYQRPADPTDARVTILNLLPWPHTRSETDPALLARLRGVVEVRPAGLPEDLLPLAREIQPGSEAWKDLRARGLTHLREQLTKHCQARIAFGGKLSGYEGRIPGIVEEVLLALKAGQPVYLAGLLGGAAEALGKALLDGHDPAGILSDKPLPELRQRLLDNGLEEKENRQLLSTTLEEEATDLILRGLKKVGRQADHPA